MSSSFIALDASPGWDALAGIQQLIANRRLDEANARLAAFRSAGPRESIEYHRLRGVAAMILGDDRGAIRHLTSALRQNREFHDLRVRTRNNLAAALLRMSRLRESESQLRRALQEVRLHREAAGFEFHLLSTLVVLLRRMGRLDAAIHVADEGLARLGDGASAALTRLGLVNNLALVWIDSGDPHRALELFDGLRPTESESHIPAVFVPTRLTIALAHIVRGDVPTAREALRVAGESLAPDDREASLLHRLYLADCDRLEGSVARGLDTYLELQARAGREALLSDHRAGIARRAAEALLDLDRPQEALEQSRRAACRRGGQPRLERIAGFRLASMALARLGRLAEARQELAYAEACLSGTQATAEADLVHAASIELGLDVPRGSRVEDPPALLRPEVRAAGGRRYVLRDGRTFITHDMDLVSGLTAAAADTLPVFIVGETGTGKDLVAHLLHELGARADRPFVVVDCATLSEGLAESELFGSARGSFSGAIADRAGLVGEADGGTLFLDELPELSPALQAKLLRFLGDGSYRRVGESRPRHSDARIIAATNRDPTLLMALGSLRSDLFFRLNGHRLQLRPLRERPLDLVAIAAALTRQARLSGIRASALERLRAHDWPGNVRELEMEVRSAAARSAPGEWLSAGSLRSFVGTASAAREDRTTALGGLRARRAVAERAILEEALARSQGNVAAAARELGVSRQAAHQALRRAGVRRAPGQLPVDPSIEA